MQAGGDSNDVCIRQDTVGRLFSDFESLDTQLRSLNPTEAGLVVKIGEPEKAVRFSYRVIDSWDAYSRTAKMENGKWATVQVLGRDWGFASIFKLNVFDRNGNRAVSVAVEDDCKGGDIVFSEQAKLSGRDAFFMGALRAVTGDRKVFFQLPDNALPKPF